MSRLPLFQRCASADPSACPIAPAGDSADLHPQDAAEPPGGIVGLRTVVVDEDLAEAAITKEGAAEFSNIPGGF